MAEWALHLPQEQTVVWVGDYVGPHQGFDMGPVYDNYLPSSRIAMC